MGEVAEGFARGFQNNHRIFRKSGSGLRRVNDSGIFFTNLQNQVSGLTSLIECYGRHMTCQRRKICRMHGYTSMVGQAGASQDAPVPCNAGKVNPVWFRHP